MTTIRVALPAHLRTLARVGSEVNVEVPQAPTVDAVLDSLEARYPMLRGTIRDHRTHQRRAYMRYFAAGNDISHDATDNRLPDSVVSGSEPLIVLGAIAGG